MKRTGMYWNKSNPCINTPFFNSVMSRKQFELITSFLHCCDNTRPEARRDNAAYDPLHKFRIVLDGLNNSCKWYYVPGQLTSIDESLIGMKNRIELMQYIPNTHHHKWGVKLYCHRIFYWIPYAQYGVLQQMKICPSIRTWTFIRCCYESFI